MIIDSIRNYMRNLNCLDTFNNAIRVNVNYLEPNADTYSIEEVPVEPIVKKYINGDSIRQYAFIFTSREPYGADVLTNIDNSGFYEKLADEIEKNNYNDGMGNHYEIYRKSGKFMLQVLDMLLLLQKIQRSIK